MTSPDEQAEAATRAERVMTRMVEEALELRHGSAGDPEGPIVGIDPELGPAAVDHELHRVRGRADRVDRLLSDITRVRGNIRRQQAAAKFQAENAFNQATSDNAASRTRDFVSREERIADAALDSFNERRAAYLADRLVSVADECYEVIRGVNFQFGAIRNDLRATLHALQFESSLER